MALISLLSSIQNYGSFCSLPSLFLTYLLFLTLHSLLPCYFHYSLSTVLPAFTLLYSLPFFDIYFFIYILHCIPLLPISFSSSFFLTLFLPFSLFFLFSLWRREDFHSFHRTHTAIRNLGLIQQPNGFRITWTNKLYYFLLIYFNSKPLQWIFRKWEGVVGTRWNWLRIGTGGGHLWVRCWTFGFQKCGEFLD